MSTGELPPIDTTGQPPESAPGAPSNATPIAQRAVRGGLWVIASAYWTIGFGFAANILLTRLLTPAVYGEYALATFFAMLFQLRTKFGISYAYAQERAVTGEAVGTVFTLDVLLGVGGVLIGVVAVPILLAFGYSASIVAMMLALLTAGLIDSVLAVFMTTLDRDLHFKPGSVIASIILPLSYLPAFWLAWMGRGSLSLISQAITFALLTFVFYAAFIGLRMRWLFGLRWRFDGSLARRLLNFGALSGFATFLMGMVSQTDNFVVGTRNGAVALGYYDRAYRTAQWPNLLLNTLLARSALFTYAQIKDDAARLRKTVSMVLWLIVSMAAPIALALFITAPDLILLVYGARWLPAVPSLRLLVAAALLRPVWDNAFVLFVGTGRPRTAIWISVVQLAVIFGLGWLLAGSFGAAGVGVAVILAYLLALVLAYRLTADQLQLDSVSLFAKPLLAALGVLAGYWVLGRLLPLNDWPLWLRVVSKGGYAVAGYYLLGFLLQPHATRERLQYIWRLLR